MTDDAGPQAGSRPPSPRRPGPASAGGVPPRISTGWAHQVGRFLAYGVWHTTVDGQENVPKSGPAVISANHTGVIDGPLVFGACPRGVHFLIKQELARGITGRILLAAGQLPVDRSSGRAALLRGREVLRAGRVVGIFPEGNRGAGKVEDVKAGVAWLAVNGNAPVIPVACLGTRRTGEKLGVVPGFRRHLHVSFGPPIVVPTEGPGRQNVATALEMIRAAMTAHIADAVERTGLSLPDDDPRRA